MGFDLEMGSMPQEDVTDCERKGTGQALFSSSCSVFCIFCVAGLDFSAPLLDDKRS